MSEQPRHEDWCPCSQLIGAPMDDGESAEMGAFAWPADACVCGAVPVAPPLTAGPVAPPPDNDDARWQQVAIRRLRHELLHLAARPPTAGDLLIRAVDRAMQHGMSCTVEECATCDAGFNQIRLAYKVWANSIHQAPSAPRGAARPPQPCTCGEENGLAVYSPTCPNAYHAERAARPPASPQEGHTNEHAQTPVSSPHVPLRDPLCPPLHDGGDGLCDTGPMGTGRVGPPASPPALDWQPIETAPHDNQRRLFRLASGWVTFGVWTNYYGGRFLMESGKYAEPTHWCEEAALAVPPEAPPP